MPPEPYVARAFRFACAIMALDAELRRSARVPEHIADQLLKAGTSVAANLEEAKGAQSRRDATAKFAIALKEAREAAYWLRLLLASNRVEPEQVTALGREAHELVAILTTSVRRLREPESTSRRHPRKSSDG